MNFEKHSPENTHQEDLGKIFQSLDAYKSEIDEEVSESIKSGKIESPKQRKPSPEEISEVKEAVSDLLQLGVFPKVTVSREHLQSILKDGLVERDTAYQKGVKLIVGTLGREPLLPEGQDRVVLELHVDPKDVEPRFTGPANRFDGVVRINAHTIPPENIVVIHQNDKKKKAS